MHGQQNIKRVSDILDCSVMSVFFFKYIYIYIYIYIFRSFRNITAMHDGV